MKNTFLSALVFVLLSLVASAAKPNDTCSIITFAIIGDYGSGDTNELYVAKMVDSWDPDFIVTVGDNSYDDDKGDNLDINVGKYYSKYIYNPKNPMMKTDSTGKAFAQKRNLFFPCMGNHDAKNSESFDNYLRYFGVPKNYSFTKGPCSFYFFYSGPHGHGDGNGEFDAETKTFISTALDGKKAGDNFRLVFFHHPPHSSNAMGNPKINAAFDFDTMHVDAVICGHEHQYERITRRAAATPVYIVNGTGGADLTSDKYINKKMLGPELTGRFLDNHHFGAMKATIICIAANKIICFEYYTTDGRAYHLEDKFVLER